MSHTIGQAEQNTQESNFNSMPPQDSSNPEDGRVESTSELSDADYEFLFNQLLEGVAHGWHDRRIIKFFNHLGDRGQQVEWVAWLERLRTKLLKLPPQSKRQLGTIMIRLGELTQSATEVKQIGAASRRIGRELLFGETPAEIWEYVGPDLTPASTQIETEQDFSKRLPDSFAALGAETANEEADFGIELDSPWDIDTQDEQDKNIGSDAAIDAALQRSEVTRDEIVDMAMETAESSLEEFAPELDTDTDTDTAADEVELDSKIDSYFDLLEGKSKDDTATLDTASANSTSQDNLDLMTSASNSPTSSKKEINLDLDLDNEIDSVGQVTSYGEEFELELDRQPESEISSVDDKASTSVPNRLADALRGLASETESLDSDEPNLKQQTIVSTQNKGQKLPQDLTQVSLSPQSEDLAAESIDESSLEVIESWFNLGLKLVSAGEYGRAIASWDKALAIDANLSEAWHNRGSALGRLGNYEEAVKSFQNALKIDPDNYQAWNDRAHALYQLQNWSDAVESWNRAIKIMPGNHLFWYNRGCALEQLNQWSDAIASYEKALEIKPDFQPGRSRYINLIADDSRVN